MNKRLYSFCHVCKPNRSLLLEFTRQKSSETYSFTEQRLWSLWGEFRGVSRNYDEVIDPGRTPWDHLVGSVSCGRPPSPPQWVPSLPASCCTASSSRPHALVPLCASHACPPLLVPGRRKQIGGQSVSQSVREISQIRDTGKHKNNFTFFSFSLFFSSPSESLLSEPCFLFFLLFFFFFFSFTILSRCIWGSNTLTQ